MYRNVSILGVSIFFPILNSNTDHTCETRPFYAKYVPSALMQHWARWTNVRIDFWRSTSESTWVSLSRLLVWLECHRSESLSLEFSGLEIGSNHREPNQANTADGQALLFASWTKIRIPPRYKEQVHYFQPLPILKSIPKSDLQKSSHTLVDR